MNDMKQEGFMTRQDYKDFEEIEKELHYGKKQINDYLNDKRPTIFDDPQRFFEWITSKN